MKTDSPSPRADVPAADSREFDLRNTDELYRVLVDQAPDAIFVSDDKFRFIEVNARGCEMSGYSRAEVLRMSIFDFMFPADVISNPLKFDELKQGKTVVNERRLKKKDGRATPVEVTAKLLSDGRLQAIVRDLTSKKAAEGERKKLDAARRESEEKLTLAMRAANMGSWVLNIDTRQFEADPVAKAMHGFSEDEPITKLHQSSRFIHPDDVPETDHRFRHAQQTRGSYEAEYRVVLPDGNTRWISSFGKVQENTPYLIGMVQDITERKRTEEARGELSRLLEESLNEIYVFDAHTLRFVQMNYGARHNLGYTLDELRALTPLDLKPEFDAQKFDDLLRPLRTGEKSKVVFVTKHRRKDHSLYDVEVHLQMAKFDGRSVFAAIILDITERKQAEEELKAGRERFETIFKAAPASVMLSSLPDGKTVEVNDNFTGITGYTRDEALGKTTDELNMWADPAARDHFRSLLQSQGIVRDFEADLNHRSGSIRNGLVSGFIVMIQGQKYLLGVFYDITERKQAEAALRASERRLRELLEDVELIAVLLDVEGRVTFCNDFLLRLTGYSVNDVVSSDWFDMFVPEQRPDVKRSFLEALRTGAVSKHFENPICTKRGELRDIAWSNTVLRDTDGRVIGTASIGEDITERKEAEERLFLSEQKFSDAFQTSPAGITITRIADGTFIDVNEAFLRMFGFTREEVLGHTSIELNILSPEERERLIEAQVESGGLRNAELLARTKSGRRISILFSSKPIEWEGETQHITTLIDISDRKQAEAALRETREQLESALAAGSVGTWVWDLVNNRAFADEYLSELFSIKSESDAEGDALDKFFQAIDEADRPQVQAAIERTIKFDEKYDIEFRVLPLDKKPRWLHGRGRIERDAAGNALRFLGMLMDITDRKRAEAALRESEIKFRILAETAASAILMYQEDQLIYANSATSAITGYSVEELVGMSLWDLVHPHFKPMIIQRRRAREQGEPIPLRNEIKFITKSGEECWVDYTVGFIPFEGRPTTIGTAFDITERKLAEEQLKTSSEQLRALSARLQSAREEEGTRIAREIHDELGGALTGLKWDLETVDKTLSVSGNGAAIVPVREKIARIDKSIESTIEIVRRISSELRPGVLDDLGLVAAVEWQAQQFQQRTGINVKCDSCADVNVSRERAIAVFRIFQELLTNVLRHSEAKRVNVRTLHDNGSFVLEVRDNGRGITEAQKTNKNSLGLLGMQERAHLVGGEISISGEKGKGTTVIVRVPAE